LKKLILYCFLLFSGNVFSQSLQFYREDISFEIKEAFFYVDGIYNFCNNGNKKIQQVLFYPFPLDSLYGEVDYVYVTDFNSGSKNIITNKSEKGFYFEINLAPYGINKYRISYRQMLLKNKAEYILLTTQKWGKPFENAIYKLTTPGSIKITSFSYTPDDTIQSGDKTIYYWNKKDFMPNSNMVFNFDR